jgi:hypothetical protein
MKTVVRPESQEVIPMPWRARLNADPLPWLLEPENPVVRYFTLADLLGRPADDQEAVVAKTAINASHPVKAILEAQHPDGYWVKPGHGYSPKYRSTVWQVMFLDQLGADGRDPRVRAACEYVLAHTQAPNGGFGYSARWDAAHPANSVVIHCLHGNLLRALLNFGYADDERVRRAIDWQARSITGDKFSDYYKSGTTRPGFGCVANAGQPCAWGAIKALRALARVPAGSQTRQVKKAIQVGAAFLLAELGHGRDRRLRPAMEWLLSRQDGQGRWKNEYAYAGKLWADIEPQGGVSKWVTLRACRVLKAAAY